MKIAIINFPGSNAETESGYAVRQAGMESQEFFWNESAKNLSAFDGYFLVGGFSYEDRSRAGIIASLDPLLTQLKREAEKGKPVLGVCNGAQILVESGMVPGLPDYHIGMALAVNKRMQEDKVLGTGYYNAWVQIQCAVPSTACAFTRNFKPGEFFSLPVAHGEGRFVIPEALLHELQQHSMTVFRYCDEAGRVSEEFPINPNGATYNLAAVSNASGNVMAIMPHPERVTAGQPIFTSMRDYIQENTQMTVSTLQYEPEEYIPEPYQPDTHAYALLIDSIITDNEAATVENTLRQMGIECGMSKQIHWEIGLESSSDQDTTLKEIYESGELFNANKETAELLTSGTKKTGKSATASFLIRYRDDFVGLSKRDTLHQFGLNDITEIKKGLLWHITVPEENMLEEVVQQILRTHILFNPYSQICYHYS